MLVAVGKQPQITFFIHHYDLFVKGPIAFIKNYEQFINKFKFLQNNE
jgi:hypothetical protein